MKASKTLPLLAALLVSACTVFPDSPPARLYSVDLGASRGVQSCSGLRFALREIRLPGYLDRHEVLLGLNGSLVEVSAQHLWASPLSRELTRLLAQGVQDRLKGASLMPYPVRQAERPDWILIPEITRISHGEKAYSLSLQLNVLRLDDNGMAAKGSRSAEPLSAQVQLPLGGENPDNATRAARSARLLGEATGAALDQLTPRLARQLCPPA